MPHFIHVLCFGHPTSVSLKPLNEISNATGGYLQNKGAFDLVSNFSGLLKSRLPGGFKYFLFSPLPGEDFQFDYYIIFFKWVETTNQKMFYVFSSSLEVNIFYIIYEYACIEVVLSMLSPFPEMGFLLFRTPDPYKIYKPSFATIAQGTGAFTPHIRYRIVLEFSQVGGFFFRGRTQSGESL